MNAAELLDTLRRRGVRLWAEGDKLCVEATRGVMTSHLLQALADHKVEVLALLQPTVVVAAEGIADDLEAREHARLHALAKRLRRGEIAALRCGITGQRCTLCHGVPCWGSVSWED